MNSEKLIPGVCAALLAFATPTHAATISGGTLLTQPGADQIEAWLEATPGLTYSGSLSFSNIGSFSSGTNTAADFHAAVDGKGPTIILYEVTGIGDPFSGNPIPANMLLGGFDPQSWNSSGTYNITANNSDRTAFIFNLTSNQILRQNTADSFGQYQTYNDAGYGPSFGGGFDLGCRRKVGRN